jgi:hypothetical protein
MMKKKIFGMMTLIVAVMLAFGFVGCGDDGTGDGNNDDPNKVATPTASPAGGTYATAQTVTLSTTTSGASIRYTTNGNNPTSTSGTLVSGTISVTATTTIKAIAYKEGMTDSAILTAAYTISGGSSCPPHQWPSTYQSSSPIYHWKLCEKCGALEGNAADLHAPHYPQCPDCGYDFAPVIAQAASQAIQLTADEWTDGEITSPTGIQWFKVTANVSYGQNQSLYIQPGTLATVMILPFNDQMQPLAYYAADVPFNNYTRLGFQVGTSTANVYYIMVGAYAPAYVVPTNAPTGRYKITFSADPDNPPPNN